MKELTKKVHKQVEWLGYKLEAYTYEALFRYLMEHEKMYIMAFPTPRRGWDAKIVLLCKPNKFDGKINAVDVDCNVKTYDDAIQKGVELAVEHIYKAHRELCMHLRKGDLDEFVKENEKRMEESGFEL